MDKPFEIGNYSFFILSHHFLLLLLTFLCVFVPQTEIVHQLLSLFIRPPTPRQYPISLNVPTLSAFPAATTSNQYQYPPPPPPPPPLEPNGLLRVQSLVGNGNSSSN